MGNITHTHTTTLVADGYGSRDVSRKTIANDTQYLDTTPEGNESVITCIGGLDMSQQPPLNSGLETWLIHEATFDGEEFADACAKCHSTVQESKQPICRDAKHSTYVMCSACSTRQWNFRVALSVHVAFVKWQYHSEIVQPSFLGQDFSQSLRAEHP
eukprot:3296640-Amphidinium_carterae.1